jgi:hypothetical protein
MYYRRLPKTDTARIRALCRLLELEQERGYQNLPFSLSNFNKVKLQHTLFASKLQNLTQATERWQHTNVKFQQIKQKLKLYISHFIQVYNFAVIRGEFKQNGKLYFQLPVDESFNLPNLSSEEKIIECSKNLIDGERKRILEGGTPMTNPTIANLNVYYEQFKDMHFEQDIKVKAIKRERETVINERITVDELIKNIWNEIEHNFDNLPSDKKIAECQKCGIIYYCRNSEAENADEEGNLKIPFN